MILGNFAQLPNTLFLFCNLYIINTAHAVIPVRCFFYHKTVSCTFTTESMLYVDVDLGKGLRPFPSAQKPQHDFNSVSGFL